jgi:uncharacterized protein Veg
MANLTHLFKVGQKVKIKNTDFDAIKKFNNGVVKETYTDHIIVTNTDYDFDGWYEEGFNIDCIYPEYNF